MICDIGISSVTVSPDEVLCNGTLQPSISTIFMTGNSTQSSITITNIHVAIVFQGINLSTTAAVMISASSATLIAVGTNTIRSTVALKAGIECSFDSNIAIQAVGESSLFVTGAQMLPELVQV
jgi:hypothetical protein